ncbi:ATP-binding protein [uncultured Sphaerochaeta sp.]|uniref:ATP-binding protein n=1 Tax=uncultured Sphaerochaeta sp. TaxID=886478 RepID=UPI002A0A3A6B|nr:ATP-binding protein [uncultured Sphaerochaeta sp.]
MLIKRTKELEILNTAYKSDKLELIMVYGKRRVGKTTLLMQFCEDKKVIFHVTTSTNPHRILQDLARDINSETETGKLQFDTFQDALDTIDTLSKHQRLIVVLDEFPIMAKSLESCMGDLQRYIDFHKENKNLTIVLCGSSLSFMKQQIEDYQSPLYGRKTAKLFIQPFTLYQSRELLPNLSLEELLQVYSVCGGIAQYLLAFSSNEPIKKQIKSLFLQPQGVLSNEAIQLLQMEVKDVGTYREILEQVASGVNQSNKIGDKIHRSPAVVSMALANLEILELVKKENPIGKTTRRGHWVITDSLFAFYFRFVSPFIGLLDRGATVGPYAYFEKNYNQYLGFAFEKVCANHLFTQSYPFIKIGKWWGPNPVKKQEEEIDIMAVELNGTVHFGECKWTKEYLDSAGLDTLIARSYLAEPNGPREYWLYAKSGFSKALLDKSRQDKTIHLISLGDLFVPILPLPLSSD